MKSHKTEQKVQFELMSRNVYIELGLASRKIILKNTLPSCHLSYAEATLR